MHSIWQTLALLGDSRALLPLATVLIGAGLWQRRAWASRWCMGLIAVGLTTFATKLAFLGWGVGIAKLDFTGFSGHAAMSAVAWPVVLSIAARRRDAGPWGFATGLLLAAAIAYSRLPLNAHSGSEVVGGWLIGALASLWIAKALHHAPRELSVWMMPLALAAGICLPLSFPRIHTHEIVVQLAKTLSGSAKEFDRSVFRRP